jgi:hypothetical protein
LGERGTDAAGLTEYALVDTRLVGLLHRDGYVLIGIAADVVRAVELLGCDECSAGIRAFPNAPPVGLEYLPAPFQPDVSIEERIVLLLRHPCHRQVSPGVMREQGEDIDLRCQPVSFGREVLVTVDNLELLHGFDEPGFQLGQLAVPYAFRHPQFSFVCG